MLQFIIIGFLLFSGFLLIMKSLQNGLEDNNNLDSKNTSSINYKLLGIKGPTKLIFGILMLVLAFYLNRHSKQEELSNSVSLLQAQKDSLSKIIENNKQKDTSNSNSKFNEIFYYHQPKSIFDGKILITSSSGGIIDSASLTFLGILGVSKNKKEGFNSNMIKISKGERIFILLEDSSRWGLNILDISQGINVEFFKLK